MRNSLVLKSFLAFAIAGAPSISIAAKNPDKALPLLKDFQETAATAATHADNLQSLTHGHGADWQVHATNLLRLKDDINQMGQCLTALEKVSDTASPWEKKAIEEAYPLLKQMAENTQSAIAYVNENRDRLFLPTYTKYLDNLADESEHLSESVNHFVQFAKVHNKEDRLQKTLGIAGGSF